MIKYFFICSMAVVLLHSCNPEDANDVRPEVVVRDTLISEGNSKATHKISFHIDEPLSEAITIDFETRDGSATAGEDYEKKQNGRLVFEPGETEASLEVDVLGDVKIEEDENFFIDFLYIDNALLPVGSLKVTIVNDDVDNATAGKLEIPESGYSTPGSYDGYDLAWSDEFDSPDLDGEHWSYEVGDGCPELCGWGNAELQYYTSDNTSVEAGNLVIKAAKENRGSKSYTSSRIITKEKLSVQYGRVDIRAALPYGQGLWPALWMLGANIDQVGWPACGEIDIMELIGGGDKDRTVHGTVHWSNGGQHANYGGSKTIPGSFQDTYHVFSIIWDEAKIQWLLDDQIYHTIDITPAELSEFRDEFFFIFNVAVGGQWPGSPNDSTIFPQYMIVDYIRVFQKK